MSSHAFFSARNRFIPAYGLLVAQALACGGGNDFTASNAPDGGSASEDSDRTTIVANPNADSNEASASPSGNADATAGLDVGVTDSPGPDALVCPPVDIACDGGCIANDMSNCGACGNTCATPVNGTATCNASASTYACGVTCNANYAKCGPSCVDTQSDAKNCGTCGHDCLGGTCVAGKCQAWTVVQISSGTISAWLGSVASLRGLIATDGKNVVWVDSEQGILEVPIEGGAVVNLAAFAQASGVSFESLAMGNGHVVWTMNDSTNGVTVWTAAEGVANSGKVSKSLGTVTSGEFPRDLALDSTGTTAYFIEDPAAGSGGQAVLYKCDLASNTCSHLQNVTASNGTAPNNVIVVGSKLYWSDSTDGSIWRFDYSQDTVGHPIVMVQTYSPYSLAVDSAYLYWVGADSPNGKFTIDRTPLASPGSVQTIVPSTSGIVTAMAVDGTNVYFDDFMPGALDYVPVAGGSVAPVVAAAPVALAIAGGAIYWLDLTDHVIHGISFP